MLSTEQTRELARLRDMGRKPVEIAAAIGCSLSTVYNQLRGVGTERSKRADAGASRMPGMDEFVQAVKVEYVSQSKRRRNLQACIDAARGRLMALGQSSPALFASRATQYRWISRVAREESWHTIWDYKKFKHGTQAIMPKLNYDYWKLLGYNDLWVIDGRKADQWVVHPETGRPVAPQCFVVMELKTRSFLHVSWSLQAFNAEQVAMLLISTALQFGPPRLGILCDNGMEQVGRDNVLMMESFWEPEIIEAYRAQAISEFTAFFPGAISPVVTSLARIPTEFGKAVLERSFLEIQNRFDAMLARDAYQGGSRADAVHRTLTRTPKPNKIWNTWDRFTARMDWFFRATEPSDGLSPYHLIERPKALQSMTEECGLVPSPANAVDFCAATYAPRQLPDRNLFRIAYYALPRHNRKRVTAIGQVTYQHDKRTRSYHCAALDYRTLGQHVDVVPDPSDPTRAGIFVHGSPQFIGVAVDISTRVNNGQITVGQGREISAQFRRDRMQELRTDADAITEKPHTVPEVLHGVSESKPIQFIPQQSLIEDEVNYDDLSPEVRELLR